MELSSAGWTAIGGVIVATITGFVAWINGRNSSVAVLQNALVQGFKELNEQRSDAMLAMREELDEVKLELSELKGELAQEKQKSSSLRNLLRAAGVEVPRDTKTEVVFTPYPLAVAGQSEGSI